MSYLIHYSIQPFRHFKFRLHIAHCDHSRDFSIKTAEVTQDYATRIHMRLHRFQYFYHMSEHSVQCSILKRPVSTQCELCLFYVCGVLCLAGHVVVCFVFVECVVLSRLSCDTLHTSTHIHTHSDNHYNRNKFVIIYIYIYMQYFT